LPLSLHLATRSCRTALVACAALHWNCEAPRSPERSEPGSSSSASAATRRTAIALVAEPKFDFGSVVQGDTLRHAFVTHNATRVALEIEHPREALGCSGTAVPRVLGPGRTGKLEITCRANVFGPLRVSLPLRANGGPAGELVLVGEVEPLLAFDHSLLEVQVPFGARGFAQARLRGARASAARLVPLTALPEGAVVTVLAPADGQSQGVALHVTTVAAGTHAGSLRFATGLAEPKQVELPYLIKIASTLAISPTNPVLDLRAGAGAQTTLRVSSQRPAFRVQRVEVLDGPFSARFRQDGDAYAVEVSIVPAKIAAGAHGANGRLLIVSNDRAEPRKEVPLFALGALWRHHAGE
jgi:hypothetical protein